GAARAEPHVADRAPAGDPCRPGTGPGPGADPPDGNRRRGRGGARQPADHDDPYPAWPAGHPGRRPPAPRAGRSGGGAELTVNLKTLPAEVTAAPRAAVTLPAWAGAAALGVMAAVGGAAVGLPLLEIEPRRT